MALAARHPRRVDTATVCALAATRRLEDQIGCAAVLPGVRSNLELNPNGQWGWIEDQTDLPITSAMADLLTGGNVT